MDFTEKKSLFTQIKFLKTIELQPNWFNQMKIHWVLLIATEQKQNNVLPNLPIKKMKLNKNGRICIRYIYVCVETCCSKAALNKTRNKEQRRIINIWIIKSKELARNNIIVVIM